MTETEQIIQLVREHHKLRLEELLRPMTERQREACQLRYIRGWPLKRIARRLRIGTTGVCQLLARARAKYPHPRQPRARQPKKRTVAAISLSDVYEI